MSFDKYVQIFCHLSTELILKNRYFKVFEGALIWRLGNEWQKMIIISQNFNFEPVLYFYLILHLLSVLVNIHFHGIMQNHLYNLMHISYWCSRWIEHDLKLCQVVFHVFILFYHWFVYLLLFVVCSVTRGLVEFQAVIFQCIYKQWSIMSKAFIKSRNRA